MDAGLYHDLAECETDLDGALDRFCGDEALYAECLQDFLDDTTMAELDDALAAQAWDDAFTAAHAIKGLAGNMGFIPLFHASAEMVTLIRSGRVRDIGASYLEVRRCYVRLIKVIRQNYEAIGVGPKGE